MISFFYLTCGFKMNNFQVILLFGCLYLCLVQRQRLFLFSRFAGVNFDLSIIHSQSVVITKDTKSEYFSGLFSKQIDKAKSITREPLLVY